MCISYFSDKNSISTNYLRCVSFEMNYSLKFSTLLAFVYFFSTCFYLASSIEYPGEIDPTRIDIEIGSNANITCRMNLQIFEGENSSSLYFIEDDTKYRVPQSDIAIINASTIVYMLQNAKEQDRSYTCMSGKYGIGIVRVVVGTPPVEVEKFKCRTYDFQYMICNFTIPPNYIYTHYNLNYSVSSPYNGPRELPNGTIVNEIKYAPQVYTRKCNIERDGLNAGCKLSNESGQYRPHFKFYNFTLTSSNKLGIRQQNFWINHFESVIPSQPVLKQINVTNNSISFHWSMKAYLYKARSLRFEILLRPDKFDWIDYNDYNTSRNKDGYDLKLFNLPYAYYNYTINVRVRVKSGQTDEDLWSEPYSQKFQTGNCLPDAPPKTDVGSFDLIDVKEPRLRLYWEDRPIYRENGANFHYVVKQKRQSDGVIIEIPPIHIDRTSAVFQWDRYQQYEFIINSRNDVGYSIESSSISIPAWGKRRMQDFSPHWIRNVYHEPNRTYTLSWNPPVQQNDLIDYTVFWCFSKRALFNECNDTIHFKHLSKDITKYTTESQLQEQTLNLAVSANYKNFSSGIHWAMCTVDVSSNLIKMEPRLKNDSLREIDVQWNLEYVCTSLLEGYNLTYCPVKNLDTTDCLDDNNKTVTVKNNAKNYVIKDLKPFTPYKVEIYMFSKLKVGKTSDAKIILTRQEAPSPPRNLRFSNITSDSVWLYWLPPTDFNGIINSYTVVENNKHHVINCYNNADKNPCDISNDAEIKYELGPLNSYTNYTVYVLANTVEASNPSNVVKFMTLVGVPSTPCGLETKVIESGTILSWNQTNSTSDRVDFYEVTIESWYKNNIESIHTYGVIESTYCNINIPTCASQHQQHIIKVAAVTAVSRENEIDIKLLSKIQYNENQIDVKYFSEGNELKCYSKNLNLAMQYKKWEAFQNTDKYVFYRSLGDSKTYGCAPPTENINMFIIVIGVGIGVIISSFFAKFSYDKYEKMRNISAKLPQGLIGGYPLSKDNSAYINNSNERDEAFYAHTKEVDKNEHKRLLRSDSGYLGDSGEISAIGLSTPPIIADYTNKYVDNNDNLEISDAVPPNFNQDNNDSAYTFMQIPKIKQINQNNINNNDGYVPPNSVEDLTTEKISIKMKPFTSSVHPQLPPFIPTDNCYVKPNKFFNVPSQNSLTTSLANENGTAINSSAMPNISSSGYIQTQASCQKPTTPAFASYTTLDALNKHESGITAFQPEQPSSGYVTHKELSAMGRDRLS